VALGFKCESNLAANAIDRAVTEKHAFYSCETVRNAITSQFIRDLKGTIVSLFNENSALGKNYVFDIRRTCREVYDHTRRALYQLESQPNADELLLENQSNTFEPDDGTPKMVRSYESQDTGSRQLHMNDESMAGPCSRACCKSVQKKLASLQDSMLCRICMDADVCTAFFPCRHVVCCSGCAPLCDICPLCRTLVQNSQHIYLPVAGTPLRECDDGQRS